MTTATAEKKYRVFGYTAAQLRTNNSSDSILGVTRGALGAVEYVAHLLGDADLIVVQRMPDGVEDEDA